MEKYLQQIKKSSVFSIFYFSCTGNFMGKHLQHHRKSTRLSTITLFTGFQKIQACPFLISDERNLNSLIISIIWILLHLARRIPWENSSTSHDLNYSIGWDPLGSVSLHKKRGFSLRISLGNMTKLAVSCGFGHIY